MVKDSSPAREIPKNFLEQSISLVERSSLKMCPVIKEVRKRIVGAQNRSEEEKKNDSRIDETNKSKSQNSPTKLNGEDEEDLEEEKPDMRSVLGFLN